MKLKWYALALGLTATLVFATGKINAQSAVVPAEVHVTRDADVFSLFSNILNAPTVACKFTRGIAIFNLGQSYIVIIGTVEPDGSLTIDRQSLLDALEPREAVFLGIHSECGNTGGDFGAQAFRARIRTLQHLEVTSLHTLYFPCPQSPVACNVE